MTTWTHLPSVMLVMFVQRVFATLAGVSMLKCGMDISVMMTLTTTGKRHNIRGYRHRKVKEHHPK
jgi:hypothetical protein